MARTSEQIAALNSLNDAIMAAWEAFGRSGHEDAENGGWEHTPSEERMPGSWCVLLPVSGNGEDQVDMFWPDFPPMPAWQTKGLLTEALDQMRGDAP